MRARHDVVTAWLILGLLFAVAGCGGDDDGEELASPDGTSWSLVGGVDITIPEGRELTIAFEGGQVSGSGGCNRFMGQYEEAGESISIGPLASTRMACPPPIMEAEQEYVAALESATGWGATEAELVLSAAGDELLRFRPASSD